MATNLADELNLLSLDLLDDHDLHLVEEVQGEITKRIPNNAEVRVQNSAT